MRVEHMVTTLSWIPSYAVPGLNKAIFESGFTHYDEPPPDALYDLDDMKRDDRFRYANRLHAWIDVEDGRITDCGYHGGSVMGATTVRVGSKDLARFQAVEFEELRAEPEIGDDSVKFVQTFGGHVALPAPRHVNRPPFVKLQAPTVWTTLALTLHTDGTAEWEFVGASPFPRHWVYDHEGKLAAKAGLADFKEWWRHSFGKETPWGETDSPDVRHRGRDCTGARPLGAHHAERREAQDPHDQGRPSADATGRAREPSCSCCSTVCSHSKSTARPSARSVRARSSASGRSSNPKAGARRRCGRSPSRGSRWPTSPRSTTKCCESCATVGSIDGSRNRGFALRRGRRRRGTERARRGGGAGGRGLARPRRRGRGRGRRRFALQGADPAGFRPRRVLGDPSARSRRRPRCVRSPSPNTAWSGSIPTHRSPIRSTAIASACSNVRSPPPRADSGPTRARTADCSSRSCAPATR